MRIPRRSSTGAVAGRPLQPLPHRHEPRLDVALAAGDAGARRRVQQWPPQVFVDFHEMSVELELLLPAGREADQRQPAEGRRALAGRLRPRECRRVLEEGLGVLRRRALRPLLSRLRRLLARAARRGRHDLRDGGRRTRGSAIKREDGTILRLADRAQRHYTTGMATVRTAAQNREALLRYTHQAARAQIDAGKNTFLLARARRISRRW
jgi:hypothetical protein